MLTKKTAVITGAGSGIGYAIARRFAGAGARLALWDVTFSEEARQEYATLGDRAVCSEVDVTREDTVREATRVALEQFGGIDILVNNAGITRDRLLVRMDENDWDAVLAVNLKGAFLCTKVVGRSMIARRTGRIVNIASIIGQIGNVGQANYAASKAGLIALTKTSAREFARAGIAVNAIAPGFILTPMTERLPQQTKDEMLARIPIGRFGTPQEVADVCLFLASDQARYVTGQVLRVDGGLVM